MAKQKRKNATTNEENATSGDTLTVCLKVKFWEKADQPPHVKGAIVELPRAVATKLVNSQKATLQDLPI